MTESGADEMTMDVVFRGCGGVWRRVSVAATVVASDASNVLRLRHTRGVRMFAQLQVNRRQRSIRALMVLAHAVLLAMLVRRPAPVFIKPSQLAFGYGGTSQHITYLSTDLFSRAEAP